MANENNIKTTFYYIFLYLCVFLSGLVPRYIFDLKIRIVIGISMYTVAVLFTWIVFVRRIKIYACIESYLFFIWAILIIGAVWRAERIGIWANYVDWILTAILFMQILYYRPDDRTFETGIRAIVDALFIQLLIGMYEITNHTYLFETGRVARRLYGNVAISMFHNSNDFATFTVTILPLAIYLLIKSKKLVFKIYYLFIVAVDVFLSLRSESRGAILGMIFMTATLLFLFFRKSKRNKQIGVFSSLIGIVLIILSSTVRKMISIAVAAVLYDQSGVSNDIRTNLIKNGFYFLKETYGFGVGAGNLYQWLSDRAIYPIGQILFIHNWYLEIAVTFGIFMFVLYMIFYLKILISFLKGFNMENGFWTAENALFVSIVAFSIVCISSSSNVYSEWVWMYNVFIATFVMAKRKRNIEKAG